MKVNNRVIDKPNEVLLVLPRNDGDLVFKFQAVTDLDDFEKMCPEPSPPKITKIGRDGPEHITNIHDPAYKASMDEWAGRQTHYQFLKSIAATDGLVWDTVKMDDPGTWQNWRTELKTAGFSIGEMNNIWAYFMKANSLSGAMIEEATKRFLTSLRERAENSQSQTGVISPSSSGEHVNGSASNHPASETLGVNAPNGQNAS